MLFSSILSCRCPGSSLGRFRRHADNPPHQPLTQHKAFQFSYLILFIDSGLDFSAVHWPERLLLLLSLCEMILEMQTVTMATPSVIFIYLFFPLSRSFAFSHLTVVKLQTTRWRFIHALLSLCVCVCFCTHLLIEPATAV